LYLPAVTCTEGTTVGMLEGCIFKTLVLLERHVH
jgi:hypothetical protein